jgi:predicted transcriptional regulator
MLTKTIQLFTEKEEEFVNLLIEIGTRKNVAKMLVYLTNIKEATSREIERGTDLRQPEVSMALKYLANQGWVKSLEKQSIKKGRPLQKYALAIPVKEIMARIEMQKKNEANNQLALIKKMRSYI